MKRIVINNGDGTVGIMIPAPKELEKMSIEDIATKDVPNNLTYRITDTVNIPSDKIFREAWTDDNPTETVDIDMPKAREIHMNKIRELRNKKLSELDIETMRGKNVELEKQTLRDIPQNLDLSMIATPEELKLTIPKELN